MQKTLECRIAKFGEITCYECKHYDGLAHFPGFIKPDGILTGEPRCWIGYRRDNEFRKQHTCKNAEKK